MYIFEHKSSNNQYANKKQIRNIKPQSKQAVLTKNNDNVRFFPIPITQRYIKEGKSGQFEFDRGRFYIPTKELDTKAGMDRCHTVSNVNIQQIIVNYLNNIVTPEEFINACVVICGSDIKGVVEQFIQFIKGASVNKEKVDAANKLYMAVVNKHYNLRYGNPSSNRTIGGCLDLFFPKIQAGKGGDKIITIKLSPIDVEVIKALISVGIEAKIKVQGNVVLSSDYQKVSGSEDKIYTYSLDTTSCTSIPNEPFIYIMANKMD